jgi:hypothetical protein
MSNRFWENLLVCSRGKVFARDQVPALNLVFAVSTTPFADKDLPAATTAAENSKLFDIQASPPLQDS